MLSRLLQIWDRLTGSAPRSKRRPTQPPTPPPDQASTPTTPAYDPRIHPASYKPLAGDGVTTRPEMFDPALKQYPSAVRQGEPSFADAEMATRWRATRRRALEQLLQVVHRSPWKENLVLRGSLLLKAWLGDEAREPGDVDWVVRPPSIKLTDAWAKEMFDGLMSAARRSGSVPVNAGKHDDGGTPGPIEIDEVRHDDIWTYDRAPGKRLVFYWRADDVPAGSVQMDFVFCEELWAEPIRASIPLQSGERLSFPAASKELSLAWKLLWLDTDSYPQGKDLYDATLLAEQVQLPLHLLAKAFHENHARAPDTYTGNYPPQWHVETHPTGAPLPAYTANYPLHWEVDWDNFVREYPWVRGTAAEWQARLVTALKRSFMLFGDGPSDAP